jgi:energy-coupling factor transporter ATP-binding protein EcfA2
MSINSNVTATIPEKPNEGKKWFSVTDLMGMTDGPQERCLWEPYIPKIGIVALAGPSDCGKSTLARQLALAVATQQSEFLNYPLNVKHGMSCYVATEDEHFGTKRVLEKQLSGFDIEGTDKLQFIFDSQSFLKDLSAFLEENKVDLVVVDAWADIFSGNPNMNTDVRQALAPWSDLAKKHECCIVMLHHNVKNSEKDKPDKNKLIGSQALEAKLRCVLELRLGNNPDERFLTILKGNYLPPEVKNKPFVLKLDSNSLLFSNTSKAIDFVSNNRGKQYDKEVWLSRFQECRSETDSVRKTVGMLEAKYPGEEVPKRSWFTENMKMLDGRSDSKENDRPTIPASMITLLDPGLEGTLPGQR